MTHAHSLREEVANALTHGLGVVAALCGSSVLITLAAIHGDAWKLGSAIVYGATLILLYVASTLYHAIPHPKAKARLKVFDHCAIYLLIAGTYTPFTLGAMRGEWGWTLFIAIWTLAALGIAVKTTHLGFRFHKTSVLLYVLMGWLIVVAAKPAMRVLSPQELGWLLAGGLCYTAGVPFYLWKSRPYTHAVWHAFVLAGVACHYVAVLGVMDAR